MPETSEQRDLDDLLLNDFTPVVNPEVKKGKDDDQKKAGNQVRAKIKVPEMISVSNIIMNVRKLEATLRTRI